jgi:chaperone BCS1
MSYCSYEGFKILATNYLDISHDNPFFGEIEGLIEDIQITPAQVAEELMKSEDAEATLEGFVKLLKRKKMEGDVCENNNKIEQEKQSKKRKVSCKQKRGGGNSKSNVGVTLRRTRGIKRGSSL